MKKLFILTAVLCSTGLAVACWFTQTTFNATYIHSVNDRVVHYTEASTLAEATYHNGMSADLPITVQVKVQDRTVSGQTLSINAAILQYRIVRLNGTSTDFITVRTLENVKWDFNYDYPVNLFGSRGVIDIPDSSISKGDSIIIRVWLTDGIYTNGNILDTITVAETPDIQTQSNISCGSGGWIAPHVVRVVYSGKRRPRVR